jgi:hypothetical protein
MSASVVDGLVSCASPPADAVAQWPRDTVPQRRPDRSLPRWVLVAILTSAALAVAFSLLTGFGRPAPWAPPVLALAVLITELAVVHLQVGRQRWDFSVVDAVITLVFVLDPGTWMVIGAAAGVAVAQLLRRQPAPKIIFNACQYAAATAVGAFVCAQSLGAGLPRLSAAAVAITAYFLVSTGLVAVVVSATTGRSLLRLLAATTPLALVHTAASASVGLLAAWLALNAPAGLVGLLVPVLLLWSSFDQTSRRAAEARLFAELAHGQEQAGGGSVDVSAQVVLTTAARLLASDVSLLLFASDGLLRYDGAEDGRPRRSRVPVSTMQEPWIPEVLSGGVVLGNDRGVPYCGMRVGPAERPLALLYARREPGSGTFTRRDASLARVLIGQAETWLSVADLAASRDAALDRADAADEAARVLGDIGANTAPALAALRESAGRLGRLAGAAGAETVDDIVEELRAAEQAVASLLGAIALAADADLAAGGRGLPLPPAGLPAPLPRAADDWTSTGVLP